MAAKIRHEGMRVPENLRQAMESPRKAEWLEALMNEYRGFVSCGALDEAGRSAVPAGANVGPTRMFFAITSDGVPGCIFKKCDLQRRSTINRTVS
eukprot:CAMPEP_0172650710 /NCGR_PEP_ID=MMETSP1068-20121228/242434_1 /TAXON_ID=35684 /ORGANISM="Pseudopedinella elastica, Strain CCMP716" /LENGTH=94 /DNA_ID=CAMNT_0013465081 /DNA_START=473 /DNA_END=757 /DNA_ORIENTATION=+